MKTFILLLSLGLVVSCGTDNRYAETLATDDKQTEQSNNTAKIVGGVAVVILATCVVAGLKKRCVPFVKRITRTDGLGKEVRQAVKDGEMTKEEAKAAEKAIRAFEDVLPDRKNLDLFQERVESLTDQDKLAKMIREGGGSVAGNEKVTRYQEDIIGKAIKQLLDEGKITPKEAKELEDLF